jgi:hypothetical protein
MTLEQFDGIIIPEGEYTLSMSSIRPISNSISSTLTPYGQERKDIAIEIIKGMVSSGLVESPEDMAKEAVRLADALLSELNK